MIHHWTKSEEEFMCTNYPLLGCAQCAHRLGIKRSVVKSKANRMSLIGPRREPFTPEQIEWFKMNYTTSSTLEIAKTLGVSRSVVYHLAESLGLRKTKDYISDMRRDIAERIGLPRNGYSKGHIPANKGQKPEQWMSPEGLARNVATRFEPGHKPKNWRPVGSERINIYGYIEVKVEDKQYGWRRKHQVVWEATNGPIPAGYNVMFKDGNRQNCSLDNLILVSNKEKMARNTIHQYPKEIKEVMMLGGLITREINKQKKQRDERM